MVKRVSTGRSIPTILQVVNFVLLRLHTTVNAHIKSLSERNLAVLYHSERNSDETKTMSAALLLTLPFWACAKDVTIIYTNDLHAHVEPYKVPWIADGKRDIGGWANITTMVKQEKAKNNATGFDAGDYFTGPYISSLTKGKAIIDIMNTMSYDAVTIGNHEFDHGWDNTLLQLSATFPIVQGNIFIRTAINRSGISPIPLSKKMA